MSDQTIEQRVTAIIVDQLNVNAEQVVPAASFLDDLGADSLDTVELIMAFEEEFKEEIDGETHFIKPPALRLDLRSEIRAGSPFHPACAVPRRQSPQAAMVSAPHGREP